jgi:hypothetical protein
MPSPTFPPSVGSITPDNASISGIANIPYLIVIFTTSTVFIVFIILQLPFTYVSSAVLLIVLEYYKRVTGLPMLSWGVGPLGWLWAS